MRRRPIRGEGFTLVEVVGGIAFLSIGLLALAGTLISTAHQREQSVSRSLVMAGAQALLEEIKCTPNLRNLALKYDKAKFKVKGVEGAISGNVLTVSVDVTNPNLVTIRLNGSWHVQGREETLALMSQIYSYNGQKA